MLVEVVVEARCDGWANGEKRRAEILFNCIPQQMGRRMPKSIPGLTAGEVEQLKIAVSRNLVLETNKLEF